MAQRPGCDLTIATLGETVPWSPTVYSPGLLASCSCGEWRFGYHDQTAAHEHWAKHAETVSG